MCIFLEKLNKQICNLNKHLVVELGRRVIFSTLDAMMILQDHRLLILLTELCYSGPSVRSAAEFACYLVVLWPSVCEVDCVRSGG